MTVPLAAAILAAAPTHSAGTPRLRPERIDGPVLHDCVAPLRDPINMVEAVLDWQSSSYVSSGLLVRCKVHSRLGGDEV